ncbi:MAG: ankyrin repeat domain-containing protein, partial [Candidatus Poribacteria bacterium]
ALPQSPGIDSGWAVADAAYVCDNREIADRIYLAGGRPTLTAYVHKRDYVVLNEIMYRDAEAVVDVLMCAIYWGDLRLVRSCLDRDPVVGSWDYEALMQIAYTWRADIDMLVETLRLLLDHGVDPNARDSETGKTALMHYSWVAPPTHRSESDILRLVAALLDAGAEPDAQKPDAGTTALAGAASTGSAELVALLLARGATPDLPTDDAEQTPAAHAEREGHPHIADLLRQPG